MTDKARVLRVVKRNVRMNRPEQTRLEHRYLVGIPTFRGTTRMVYAALAANDSPWRYGADVALLRAVAPR